MVITNILYKFGSQSLQVGHKGVFKTLGKRSNQVCCISKDELIVVQIFVIFCLAIFTVILSCIALFRTFFIHSFAVLAWGSLVEQLLNTDDNPLNMILDSSRSHFLGQVPNTLECLLDDFLVQLSC